MLKKIIDILGIVLPVLIIVLGIIRIFVKKTKGVNGFTMLFAILLLLIGVVRYLFFAGGGSKDSGPKPESLHVSKHSEAFNNSMSAVLIAYYKMTEGFVNWDTAVINNSGNELRLALDSLKIEELKKDSIIYETVLDPYTNAKTELNAILADPSIAEKRGSLNILSDNLRNLLVVVKYDREKIYWQECPMAFGEDRPGNWLSRTIEVRNPYMGIKDPQYGDKMLECGGPKDTIKFDPPADTTKKQ
ncbi:MAG: DUF3347 domain-containing protein [Sphingobacteriales bacterium]|nr:DUF3347 domain-containing protein [Sphingobacteriales bacterium]